MTIAGIIHEPEGVYHARSKSGEILSSHMLQRFAQMPYKYWATVSGLYQEPDKADYEFGRAAHKLILEGQDAFDAAYTVSDGPENPKTGKPYGKDTRAYQDWRSCQEGDVVTTADYAEIGAMRDSVRGHAEIGPLLGREGEAECVVRATLEGVECQIRMDWFSPEAGIVDLKTCRDIAFFEQDARAFGYAYQMAFYRAVLREATGRDFPVHMVAVDKGPFHVAGYWLMPSAELDVAERVNAAAIRRLKECRETGVWPTGYERRQVFTLNSNR